MATASVKRAGKVEWKQSPEFKAREAERSAYEKSLMVVRVQRTGEGDEIMVCLERRQGLKYQTAAPEVLEMLGDDRFGFFAARRTGVEWTIVRRMREMTYW
jgi:hypothetical protein